MPKRKILHFGFAALILITVVFFLPNLVASAQSSLSFADKNQVDFPSQANMNSTNFSLDWNVVGQGGGNISSPHFKVASTIGQPVLGTSSSTSFDVHAGFWQNFFRRVFLPLIIR